MRLLHARDLTLRDFVGNNIPVYAIVSHRWSEAELSYQTFLRDKEQYVSGSLQNYGWTKIVKAAKLALQDDVQWIWIDTICINKESSAELTEAINSMYDWYKYADICFVFLPDVHSDAEDMPEGSTEPTFTAEVDINIHRPADYTPVPMYEDEFIQSDWFKRSWTLQELLAPGSVIFFDSKFQSLGTRNTLALLITKATSIPQAFLGGGTWLRWDATKACVAERMKWASRRDATRNEDKAYSMLGLFQVNLPLLYGEGNRAFRRLQIEIIRETKDESILAWMSEMALIPGLASTGELSILSGNTEMFSHVRAAQWTLFQRKHYEVTNMGLRFTLPIHSNWIYPPGPPLTQMRGVHEQLAQEQTSTTILFPLNCIGICNYRSGRSVSGVIALLVMVDKQLSQPDLMTLVCGRARHLLISEDIWREHTDTRDANVGVLQPGSAHKNKDVISRRWISTVTGKRQSFDLYVDPLSAKIENEYSVYLRL